MVRVHSIPNQAASCLLLLFLLPCASFIQAWPQPQSGTDAPGPASNPPGPATTTLEATPTATTTTSTADIVISRPTPSLATNPFAPGTVNCFDFPYCKESEECYVLSDGLVCLERQLNYGYILARNESGIPSVPRWSGPKSTFNQTCTFMRVPDASLPGLALRVYNLVAHTVPKMLVLSHFELDTPNWYTLFSNCETELACKLGTCQPRPKIGEECQSSWQCNPFALGLDESNRAVSTSLNNFTASNRGSLRCEYVLGEKSDNHTCQYLVQKDDHPDTAAGSNLDRLKGDTGTTFSPWHVLLPVVLLLILIYGATVVYQRRIRRKKLSKFRQAQQQRYVRGRKAEGSTLSTQALEGAEIQRFSKLPNG
ncbi:hypothetical protein BGZ73_004774 [Actinomortierella ambigua]|nr:hypothetical protein BGZ73_004774 [Actinomortierella ambigua]